jgi:hypothetical protein
VGRADDALLAVTEALSFLRTATLEASSLDANIMPGALVNEE